jgi:hypothetical protein
MVALMLNGRRRARRAARGSAHELVPIGSMTAGKVRPVGRRSSEPRQIVARYFEMWNSGETTRAGDIVSGGWVDHLTPTSAVPMVWEKPSHAAALLNPVFDSRSRPSSTMVTWSLPSAMLREA